MSDKEFILVIKFSLIFFVTSLFGNWIFLIVFLRHTNSIWPYLENFKLNHCPRYVLNFWQCYVYFMLHQGAHLSVKHKYFCVHICTYCYDINFCTLYKKCGREELFCSFINGRFYGTILATPKKVSDSRLVCDVAFNMHVSNSSDVGVYCSCLPTCEN
jgi:hypothetical protein